MTNAMKEITLETEICEHLAANGWLYSKDDTGYDRDRALFPEDVFGWLADTQPDMLAKRIKPDLDESKRKGAENAVLDSLVKQLDTPMLAGGGTLNVLRKGFTNVNARFQMVQAQPAESNNPLLMDRYGKNRLRVMRQVHYSKGRPNRSIDLVLFCNGLPVATIELKTDFTQSVTHGKVQYAESRQPTDPGTDLREPLLTWGARAVVHFVATNQVVAMTTKLDGANTVFLPFNRGYEDGAGNPPDLEGSTTYFWRDVLQPDLWLKVLTKFMLVKTEQRIDPATGQQKKSVSIRFPRYHQLSAVEAIVADAYELGAGQKYLIEHSAGSGKTDTIVWTAHRLAALHDADNRKVFDSVIVVSDRRVLDKQISEAIVQLDPGKSLVARIDGRDGSKSKQFAERLADKTPIIVVTIQTAPFVLEYLRKNADKLGGTYAVIADEAHSSQTGDAAMKLREVLSPAEQADLADGGTFDTEALLAASMAQRGDAANISYLAFTATPKSKTMELFGRPDPQATDAQGNPLPQPFHRYTMRQAIEEGFILDVLTNFTPYKLAFKIAHNGQEYDSETIDKGKAIKSVMNFVRLHEHNISQKVAIIVEHFRKNVAVLLDGNAKAMVVTGSRREAIRYHKLLGDYITARGYTDLRALVAFSDKVTDEDFAPEGVTEHDLNPLQGRPIEDVFNGPDYRVMIVANKFQVGFDQPLLCAMYVDKRLDGVMAVQTLSRLNRTYPGKDTVYVLDFVNEGPTILDAFLPYYKGASLAAVTDQDLPHAIATKLDQQGFYDEADIQRVADLVLAGKNTKLGGAVSGPLAAFNKAWSEAQLSENKERQDELAQWRSDLSGYIKAYSFLSQIVDYEDTLLEKRYMFYQALARSLEVVGTDVDLNLDGLAMTHHRLSQQKGEKLDLESGEATPLTPLVAVGSGGLHEPDKAHWKQIVDTVNKLFAGSGLSEQDALAQLDQVLRKTKANPELVEAAKANSDVDFHSDAKVVNGFLEGVLDLQNTSHAFTDTLLKGQSFDGIMALLAMIGFRKFLAGEDK